MTAIRSHTICRSKRVIDLSQAEYDECWDNTLIQEGFPGASMRPRLQKIKMYEDAEGWAFILRDAATREFLGWALCFVDNESYIYQRGLRIAYYYVPQVHRRKGYGRILHDAVTRKFSDALVLPWDDRSREFFKSVDAEVVRLL